MCKGAQAAILATTVKLRPVICGFSTVFGHCRASTLALLSSIHYQHAINPVQGGFICLQKPVESASSSPLPMSALRLAKGTLNSTVTSLYFSSGFWAAPAWALTGG